MAELTDKQAERYIRRELKAEDWTPDAVDAAIEALKILDGVWSYGTARMIKDLERILSDLVHDHGEPPDINW